VVVLEINKITTFKTLKTMSYLSELKQFIGYCNEFYNKQYGIYPIATSEVIAGAITKYINTSTILGIDVQFDSIDRERVRYIIEGFEPNTNN
jgi:hypothetical protein